MPLPLYRPSEDPPDPIEAFEAVIPVGVSPFKVTSFKASLMREGSARVEGNFEPFTVAAGDLVLMRPGTHCTSMSLTPVEIAVVQVDPVFLVDQVRWTRPLEQRTRKATYQSLLQSARQPVLIRLQDDVFLRLAELFAQLVFLSGRPAASGRMIARATELIWEIEALFPSGRPNPVWDRIDARNLHGLRSDVQHVIHAIRDRYASDLSIRELAHEVSLSESALRRAVQAATGFSPREYLHRMRLVRFEQLVAETTMPLADAARTAGWSSTSHARSAFARSHGMSPSEYRAEARAAQRADWLRTFGA